MKSNQATKEVEKVCRNCLFVIHNWWRLNCEIWQADSLAKFPYGEVKGTDTCEHYKPKLSPDEKESLKQSENDFATGNVLTKDEAFEKLGWKESK